MTDAAGFDEQRLLEKLRAIEALFAGAATDSSLDGVVRHIAGLRIKNSFA